MPYTCKSVGCENTVENPQSDFCNSCNYIHSIIDGIPDKQQHQEEHLDITLDTYAVHHAFSLNDPSGCLQRASRIILLSGQMNEESFLPRAEDIVEARNMLTRWLQLNEYEFT